MPDVWATFTDLDAATQERLADVLETRGADSQQQAVRRASFLEDSQHPHYFTATRVSVSAFVGGV